MRAENRLASAFEEFILPYDALRTAAPDAALLELHKGETSFDREAIEAEIMTGGSGVCASLDITRRDAHPFLCLWVITGQAHAVPSRIRLTRRRGLDTVFDETIEPSSPM